MKLHGGINLDENGMVTSLHAMHLQTGIMSIVNENVAGFNKVGYQRKVPVVSSFAEFIGIHALSENKDEKVGRIKLTKNPLDVVLATKGYFQVKTPNGTKLTRDGRFKLDKDGNLLNIQDYPVMSSDGATIKFKKVPKSLELIHVDSQGNITYTDPNEVKEYKIAKIAAVSSEGEMIDNVNIKQGYVEESNVNLHEEIYSLVTMRRNFSANRQLFMLQNDALSKVLQELGRAQ
jgi:flagellar basal body rod protein FlgG